MKHIANITGINPPTATAQEKKIAIINGQPRFYKPKNVKEAERILNENLEGKDPRRPLEGPVRLTVEWKFLAKTHKPGTWRTTRPDTDNLDKMLKDVLTARGWWADDAQVCVEICSKMWSDEPGLKILAEELEDPAA